MGCYLVNLCGLCGHSQTTMSYTLKCNTHTSAQCLCIAVIKDMDKTNTFEDSNVQQCKMYTSDRENRWFERGVKKAKLEKPHSTEEAAYDTTYQPLKPDSCLLQGESPHKEVLIFNISVYFSLLTL